MLFRSRIELAPRFSAEKQRAIDELTYFSVSRVYLQTRTRFWEADGLNGFAITDHPMEIWSPAYGEDSPRGILLSYMYEDLARRVAAMGVGERVNFGMEEMGKVFPGLREHCETGTSWCWDEHPWSRGALCLYTPGQFAHFPHILKPEGRVHFAGEHTSPWPGWMQGAIYSGLRAAKEGSRDHPYAGHDQAVPSAGETWSSCVAMSACFATGRTRAPYFSAIAKSTTAFWVARSITSCR